MSGYLNIGTGTGASQAGTYADNDYHVIFDSLGNTDVGYMYLNLHNGWRGLKITGNSGFGVQIFGGVFEGINGSTDLNFGACHGSCIRIEGGSGAFYGPNVGQAMINADAAEGGFIHVTGGEWSFYSPNFYKTPALESMPMIYHRGGRLLVEGATRRLNETGWTHRPGFDTTSSGPNATATSFYCPDQSMVAV
jgi:hypothetical protein